MPPTRQAAAVMVGSNVATVPVLLIKADNSAAPSIITTSSRAALLADSRNNHSPSQAVTPVRDNPSLTTNRAAIMMTVASLKPANA